MGGCDSVQRIKKVNCVTQVMLKDHNSKYGTKVNNTKIEPLMEIPLHVGNEITFGQGSVMRYGQPRDEVQC